MSNNNYNNMDNKNYTPINPNSKNGAIVMLIGILGTAVAIGLKNLR